MNKTLILIVVFALIIVAAIAYWLMADNPSSTFRIGGSAELTPPALPE